MKHGFIISHQNQNDRHLSGLHVVNRLQSVERGSSRLARLWHQYFGIRMVYYLSTILKIEKNINSDYYIALLERLKDEIAEKRPHLKKKKVLFNQDNALCHKSMKTRAKLHELDFKLLPHPPYSPDLAPSDFFLFSDLKRMLAGKKFSANREVIAETEGYFEAKDKSYYKNGIEK